MSRFNHIFIWKRAPFLRLLIPLIAGILLAFYLPLPVLLIMSSAIILMILLVVFFLLPESIQFRYKPVQGILIFLLLIVFGVSITWQKDIRNDSRWYGHFYKGKSFIVATIAEPLQAKANSLKAIANADAIILNKIEQKTAGRFLIYFSKDSNSNNLKYGDRIIVNKQLRPILNSGNPAAVDYAQYAAFHNLYQQVYLKPNEWILLPSKNKNPWKNFIFSTRGKSCVCY